jgi:ATP-dependent DNA ligase
MPTAITPMKAALGETPPRGDEWLFEIKWDGVAGGMLHPR